jgi:hypothetical protein
MVGVTIARLLFFYTFYIIIQPEGTYITINIDIWASINLFLFGLTCGYCQTGLMTLGPEKSDDVQLKRTIGFLGGFGLTSGIACGTVLALSIKSLY